MNIETFTADNKRFYVRVVKDDGKTDVLFDGDLDSKTEIATRRKFKVSNDMRVTGALSLGFPSKQISDKQGFIYTACLERGFAKFGDKLTFDGEKWMPAAQTQTMMLDLRDVDTTYNYPHNGLSMKYVPINISDIKNTSFFTPNNMIYNHVHVTPFYLNPYDDEADIVLEWTLADITDSNLNLNELEWTNRIDTIEANTTKSLEGFDIYINSNAPHLNNKTIGLWIRRQSEKNKRDLFKQSIYLCGINIEYHIK